MCFRYVFIDTKEKRTMPTSARVYKAPGTFIIDFPPGRPEKSDGILVQQPREIFLAINQGPRFLQVKQAHWVDPEGYKKRIGYKIGSEYGRYVENDALEKSSVHVVREEEWFDRLKKGFCFYGLVLWKGNVSMSLIGEVAGKMSIVDMGDIHKEELVWYFSHPIQSIKRIRDAQSLADLCRNEQMSWSEKGKNLFERLSQVVP